MKQVLDELAKVIDQEAERAAFLRLSKQYYAACQAAERRTRSIDQPALQPAALLDQIIDRLDWHFRAIRHPRPTRQEVAAMIMTYFGEGAE